MRRACSVLDAAVVVLDSSRGVEAQTKAVWSQLAKWELPRLIFANKFDRNGASPVRCNVVFGVTVLN